MARKGAEYSDKQLAEMYRRYAELKGWSTRDDVVQDKVESWRDSSIGPVGLAIDFHKTGTDNAKHMGNDAETASAGPPARPDAPLIRSSQRRRQSKGCLGIVVVTLLASAAVYVACRFIIA